MRDVGSTSASTASEHARVAREDDDLRTSLVALARLTTSEMKLADVLTQVAESAVLAIPGADGAGLSLLNDGQAQTIVASAPFVSDVDAIQFGLGEGPCVTCATQARTVRTGELASDPQWPRLGSRIGDFGVHSALSIPLRSPDGVFGAMTVYARARDAFDDRSVRIGELFAVPAAIAVENARVLSQARLLATQLQVALTNQAAIDHAVGILMSRLGCTPGEALDQLGETSDVEGQKLHVIASRIVDDALSPTTKRLRGHPKMPTSARGDLHLGLGYQDATRAVLKAAGMLSTATTDVLSRALKHRLESGHRYVQLDVSKLLSCDRDGALSLVDAHHAFIDAKGALVLVGARTTLRQLFRLLGVDTVLFLARGTGGRPDRWAT